MRKVRKRKRKTWKMRRSSWTGSRRAWSRTQVTEHAGLARDALLFVLVLSPRSIAQHRYCAVYFIFLVRSVSLSGFYLLAVKDYLSVITTRKEISFIILCPLPKRVTINILVIDHKMGKKYLS